jgi:hypothetical protein
MSAVLRNVALATENAGLAGRRDRVIHIICDSQRKAGKALLAGYPAFGSRNANWRSTFFMSACSEALTLLATSPG